MIFKDCKKNLIYVNKKKFLVNKYINKKCYYIIIKSLFKNFK